jgi:hypothetical protein
MEYLLELQWTDPVGRAVARILSALPDDVEQATSSVPIGLSRGFTVLRCDTPAALDDLARAVTAAGADVRVIPKGGDDSRN